MIKDVNMQHMTMTEYVAVAILSDLATDNTTQKAIVANELTAQDVVRNAFAWADLFMMVREERNSAKT
jgi:hypothetical protein